MPKKKAAAPAASEVSEGPRTLTLRVREETWPIARIRPYERNAKLHPQDQVDLIRRSYREFGEVARVLVDDAGEIIAGHGRHLALTQENVAEVRVAVAVDWTDDQKRRFRLLDNQLNLASGYDEKLLKLEVIELNSLGVDVSQLGFEPGRIAGLLHVAPAGLTDPDEAPEVETAATSVRGDVWLLGRHRLTCGDSTNPQDVERVLAGAKPHLMVTDPPYGVKYDPAWRVRAGHGSDGQAVGEVLNDDRADWRARHGRYFPATSPTSGTPERTAVRLQIRLSPVASRSGRTSCVLNRAMFLAAAIITSSTNRVCTRCRMAPTSSGILCRSMRSRPIPCARAIAAITRAAASSRPSGTSNT